MIRLLRLFTVLGLVGTASIWIWTYYPTELAWISGSRFAWIRLYLVDGLLIVDAGTSKLNRPAGRSTFEANRFVDTYPYRLRPVIGSFRSFSREAWGGSQIRGVHLEVVWGFVFVIFGIVPFSFLVLLPFLKTRQGRSTKPQFSPPTPSPTVPELISPD